MSHRVANADDSHSQNAISTNFELQMVHRDKHEQDVHDDSLDQMKDLNGEIREVQEGRRSQRARQNDISVFHSRRFRNTPSLSKELGRNTDDLENVQGKASTSAEIEAGSLKARSHSAN